MKKNRIRKLLQYYKGLTLCVDPKLKLDEASIPIDFLPYIHPDFSFDDTEEKMMERLKEFDIKLTRKNESSFRIFKPVLTNDPWLGLHPLLCVGISADFDGSNLFQVELLKRD